MVLPAIFAFSKGLKIAFAIVIVLAICLVIAGIVTFNKGDKSVGTWLITGGAALLGFCAWNALRKKSFFGGFDIDLEGEDGVALDILEATGSLDPTVAVGGESTCGGGCPDGDCSCRDNINTDLGEVFDGSAPDIWDDSTGFE